MNFKERKCLSILNITTQDDVALETCVILQDLLRGRHKSSTKGITK